MNVNDSEVLNSWRDCATKNENFLILSFFIFFDQSKEKKKEIFCV